MESMSNIGGDMRRRAEALGNAIRTEMPVAVGGQFVDGFKMSFRMQKFNDDGETHWQEVKRRQIGSQWYGFQKGTNASVPEGSRGYHKSGKPRRYGTRGGTTNYSPAATTRAILFGSGSNNLQTSIYLHTARAARVVVATDQPHAEVHNEGLQSKIFGKKTFTMPKRQFMGTSNKLNRHARKTIERIITRIIQ